MATAYTTAVIGSPPTASGAAASPKFSDSVMLTSSLVVKWTLRLVFALIVARALGPGRFGVYALLFAMIEFVAVASGSGYADYVTREAAKNARKGWGLALQLTLFRISVAIIVTGIELGALSLLRYPRAVVAGTACMALTLVPRAFTEAIQAVLRGIRQYSAYLAIEAILGSSLAMGAGILFLRSGGLRMTVATEIAASVAAGLGALSFALKCKTREAIWLRRSRLVRTSVVFNLYSFLGCLYDRFDVVLLSKLAGDYATGIYSVAYRALGVTQILAYGLLYSLLPSLSGHAASAEERRRLERAMGFLLSAALVFVLATIVLAGPAVRLLLGERYAECAAVLTILIWAVPLRYMNCALNILLLAAGKERVLVLTSLVCLAVNSVGNLVLIPVYGWRAAASMTIATEVVLLAHNVYWVRRKVGRITLPRSIVNGALAFGGLVAVALTARYVGQPLVVGTACLAVFAAYLYGSGAWKEFGSVWGSGGETS